MKLNTEHPPTEIVPPLMTETVSVRLTLRIPRIVISPSTPS